MMKHNKVSHIIGIFILALSLRCAFIITYNHAAMLQNVAGGGDSPVYDKIAKNFLAGKGFVFEYIYARRGPVYPAFLAFVYFFSNGSIPTARFAQAFIGALSCVLTYLIATLIFNQLIGLIAGIIASIDYSLIQIPAYITTETLSGFIILASLYFILRSYFSGKEYKFLILGSMCAGLAALCKDTGALLIPIFMIWIMFFQKIPCTDKVKKTAIVAFFSFLVIMPWLVRNHNLYGRWVPITISLGHNLYLGNNENAQVNTGGYGPPSVYPADIQKPHSLEADEVLKRRVIEFICKNPRRALILAVNKFIEMWQPYHHQSRLISKIITTASYLPIIIFALLGFILNRKQRRISLLFIMIIIFNTIVCMIIVGTIRYRYPLIPLFIIYASYSLFHIFNKINASLNAKFK
jgi:4-amino-4-deoxy-L-arabinose transferase-like glycosyltransferase